MNNHYGKAVSSAPGKIILFGEHFVVYKNPAIVAAINKRIQVHAQVNDKLRINIKSGENSLSVPTESNEERVKVHHNSMSFLYPIYKCVKHVLSEKDNLNV